MISSEHLADFKNNVKRAYQAKYMTLFLEHNTRFDKLIHPYDVPTLCIDNDKWIKNLTDVTCKS